MISHRSLCVFRRTYLLPQRASVRASSFNTLPAPKFPAKRPKVNHADLRQLAMKLYASGIEEVSSAAMVRKTLLYRADQSVLEVFCNDFILQKEIHSTHKLDRNVYVVGFGKAIINLARAVEDLLGEHIVQGLAVVPAGTVEALKTSEKLRWFSSAESKFRVLEGGDGNIPTAESLRAAQEVSRLAKSLTAGDILICLISGGGSGLIAMPKPQITLEEKAEVTRLLDKAGVNSLEMNTVRKNLSLIKAGGLAAMAAPATVISLIVSNLPHYKSSEVASGPTTPDYSTPQQALDLFRAYGVENQVPRRVLDLLRQEAREAAGTKWFNDSSSADDIYKGPAPRYSVSNATNILAGSDEMALGAILRQCALFEIPACAILRKTDSVGTREYGRIFAAVSEFVASLLTRSVRSQADSRLVMCEVDCIRAGLSKIELKMIANAVEEACNTKKPVCLIFTSEVTVEVKGTGVGGPCQEVALATAIELRERYKSASSLKKCDVHLLSIDSDGLDGNTPVAGAVSDCFQAEHLVNGQTAQQYLDNNDSYSFYAQLEGGKYHIHTGLTGTDIQNFQILLIGYKGL